MSHASIISSLNLPISEDCARVLEAILDDAKGNGYDFACGPITVKGFSQQKLGGHMAHLIQEGYVGGEHVRVNDEGPSFMQIEIREDIQDACRADKAPTEPVTIREAGATKTHKIPEAPKPAALDLEVAAFLEGLADRVVVSQNVLNKFQENFETNPEYAFEWASSPMEAAADIGLCTRIIAVFGDTERETPLHMAELVKHLRNEQDRMAGCPSFSTSVPSNVMQTYKLKVTTEVLRKAEGRLF